MPAGGGRCRAARAGEEQGAGKTTFFNLLTGYYRPNAGSIHYRGEDITAMTPGQRVARGLMRTFQLTATFENLSVTDNLVLS